MRRPLRALLPLCAACAAAPAAGAPPWPTPARYHLRSETRLLADRWYGARPEAVERFDVRQRLQLDIFGAPAPRGPRVGFTSDLELGSDLGPSVGDLAAVAQSRRAVVDLYRAHVWVRDVFGVLDARLGRHVLVDALGFDALDGATLTLNAAPFLALEASGGLAVRRGWSDFGPDLYDEDGALLADDPGYVVGLALATREVRWLAARAAWRRVFEPDHVQREEAGVALTARPGGGLELHGRARYDAIWLRMAELGAGAALRLGDAARVGVDWLRARPTFSADSIWNAFGVQPYHAVQGRAHATLGRWHLGADGGARVFDTGDPRARSPGALNAEAVDPPEREPVAWDAGARAVRDLSGVTGPAHVGVEGRVGGGYGGVRHHADLFGRLPVHLPAGNPPLGVRARLGAVYLDDPDRDARDALAGWGLLAAEWPAAEGIVIDLLFEGSVSEDARNPWRMRAFTQVRFEDWW